MRLTLKIQTSVYGSPQQIQDICTKDWLKDTHSDGKSSDKSLMSKDDAGKTVTWRYI